MKPFAEAGPASMARFVMHWRQAMASAVHLSFRALGVEVAGLGFTA